MDEASQASTVSSAAGDENSLGGAPGDSQFPLPAGAGTPKSKNHHTFPSGASNLSSPGASSYADDFEASSPSWPRTPASPAVNSAFRGSQSGAPGTPTAGAGATGRGGGKVKVSILSTNSTSVFDKQSNVFPFLVAKI